MATIEELELRERDIQIAERIALGELADKMREVAVSLPDGSRLALTLAAAAKRLDFWGPEDAGTWGSGDINILLKEINKEQEGG